MFDGIDLSEFWADSEYARKEYDSGPFTDEDVRMLEKDLGYRLPDSYVFLMKTRNGGIPKNSCCPCRERTGCAEERIEITGIYGIGHEKNCSLGGTFGSRFWIEEWAYPDIGIAICDCPSAGHDMVFLDYRECGPEGEPGVVHIDNELDNRITVLADSFEEFIKMLVPESQYGPGGFDTAVRSGRKLFRTERSETGLWKRLLHRR